MTSMAGPSCSLHSHTVEDGRFVVAVSPIAPGDLVHRSEPFTLSVNPLHISSRCSWCLELVDAHLKPSSTSESSCSKKKNSAKNKKSHKMKSANYLAMKQDLNRKKQWGEQKKAAEQRQQHRLESDEDDDNDEEDDDKAGPQGMGSRYVPVQEGCGAVSCVYCQALYCSATCAEANASYHVGLECRMMQALAKRSAHRQIDELHYLRCMGSIILRAVKEGFGSVLSTIPCEPPRRVEPDEAVVPGKAPPETEEGSAILTASPQVGAEKPLAGRAVCTTAEIPAEAIRLRKRREQTTQVEIVDRSTAAPPAALESLAFSNTSAATKSPPSWPLFAALVTNLSDMPKDQVSKYAKLFRVFQKLVADMFPPAGEAATASSTREGDTADLDAAQLTGTSERMFMAMCAALQCNGFGVYDPAESCVAIGTYPLASFFNHSCNPNICRVMNGRAVEFYALRPILPGESLCISYVDAEKQTSERRHVLLSTYRFYCECPRCARGEPLQGHRCAQCSARGYLVPFHHLAASSESECSVCRKRSTLSGS